ncbi:putative Quinolinate synthase A [Paratrimastix pyriformis]|uniref:nicotinate-nucleotide diphosphorylase (carboxylating) n=1 Tax=Paratrimastix pyriformis TaxID=342808 RepID=A0ABQ8V1Y1_9EUKA|nr:putative Quinolinate synthase A [Paratrimastix pyriformis]
MLDSSTVPTLKDSTDALIRMALEEDHARNDVTARTILGAEQSFLVRGRVMAKGDGILCGGEIFDRVMKALDPTIRITWKVPDGHPVVTGELLAEVEGPAVSVLGTERTALNFIQHLSGIATTTASYVDACSTTRCKVLDTRKTTPGWRELEKMAVRVGGGINHRHHLADLLLIKDNHITAAGGIGPAVQRARDGAPGIPVEVEVRNDEELSEALAISPPLTRIMLDNMDLPELRRAVQLVAGRIPLEASGGINTIERAKAVAQTGVNFISVGALTHSVTALDINMKISLPGQPQAESTDERCRRLKEALGQKLVILGHYYVKDEVLKYAGYSGDSLALAFHALQAENAKYIVWLGVRFMAEMSAILCKEGQRVFMARKDAGCFLADCAPAPDLAAAWQRLDELTGGRADQEVIPVAYINSSFELKAFVGEHGGIICTSANCERVLRWAWERRRCVLFLPDQHLGNNTARLRMGVDPANILPFRMDLREDEGACSIHQRFTGADVRRARRLYPSAIVLAHPECPFEVVSQADGFGSTTYIIAQVEKATRGTVFMVATDQRLVDRLTAQHKDRGVTVMALSQPLRPEDYDVEDLASTWEIGAPLGASMGGHAAYCGYMAMSTSATLSQLLAFLTDYDAMSEPERAGPQVRRQLERYEVAVAPGHSREMARLSLQRMLDLGG